MNRRELIGTLGSAGAAAMLAGSALGNQHGLEQHAEHFDACAKACAACQLECHRCSQHCLTMLADGQKPHRETSKFCADCGDICAVAANITARRGVLAWTICQSCVEACEKCAQACEKFPDDRAMKACAEECRKCAKACREMLAYIAKETSSTR
jgi:hypothetical protein